jgi:hypothetical protein
MLKDEADDNDYVQKYGIPALMNYQYHMISQIDDATQVIHKNLKAHGPRTTMKRGMHLGSTCLLQWIPVIAHIFL